MSTQPDPNELLRLAEHHLSRVLEYDPYLNFPGIHDRSAFGALISSDPAFAPFGLDDDRYIIARIGGNLVTSLHRKIGDMYQAIFLYLLACRFNLTIASMKLNVTVKIGERDQIRSTDGMVPISCITNANLPLLKSDWKSTNGLAFEVRSCYQIGDSKRIQADWDMALALQAKNFTPVMLVFCNTSLRSPLIRLNNSWNLFTGDDAFTFIYNLTQFDLKAFLLVNQTTLTNLVHQSLAKL
ncbi:type I restriction endonuclease [Argonema galeatum]|uniref:type I restriction endonuclease n=1 Tax=Argonema galeatum TaxID=2942762 RepID=UPI002011DAD9|nr:type I restriction endonuclease [Argonema galeatum]MCL1463608.1 type I restriction endonuclease [Argonema galeatum A003/A1]